MNRDLTDDEIETGRRGLARARAALPDDDHPPEQAATAAHSAPAANPGAGPPSASADEPETLTDAVRAAQAKVIDLARYRARTERGDQ